MLLNVYLLIHAYIAKKIRINQEIRVPKVRLIDEDENQIGVVFFSDALHMAQERELDLVEVSPLADPPVCKLMDYGKFLYRKNKIDQKQKKMQKKTETRGIRISLKTEQHDLGVKAKKAREFLKQKDTIKVSLIFKGREAAHRDLALEKMKQFYDTLSDISRIEQEPKKQGNTMIMILIPSTKTESV